MKKMDISVQKKTSGGIVACPYCWQTFNFFEYGIWGISYNWHVACCARKQQRDNILAYVRG